MQGSIADLEQADQDLATEIDELSTTVDSEVDFLDSRLSQLQVDGTFAFHAYVGSYSTVPVNTIVVYDNIIINQGNGYNSGTGVFTVPTGGAGLYYFLLTLLLITIEEISLHLASGKMGLCWLWPLMMTFQDRGTQALLPVEPPPS